MVVERMVPDQGIGGLNPLGWSLLFPLSYGLTPPLLRALLALTGRCDSFHHRKVLSASSDRDEFFHHTGRKLPKKNL
jgi:hypothetical protein